MVVARPIDVLSASRTPGADSPGLGQADPAALGMRSAPVGMVVRSEEAPVDARRGEETGLIEEAEEEMLYKVFDFAEKEVHDVMVPRPEVIGVPVDLPPQETRPPSSTRRSRYPAYRDSLDEIVGVLHVRDLFSALYANGVERRHRGHPSPRTSCPRRRTSRAAADEFRRANQHMAIVVDEWRATRDRHARGPARGDRGRDRRTSTTCRTTRCSGSTGGRCVSTGRFRSTTSTSSSARSCRRRTTTRSPASSSAKLRPRARDG